MRKVLAWLALGLFMQWLIREPATAAAAARQITHAVTTLVTSL